MEKLNCIIAKLCNNPEYIMVNVVIDNFVAFKAVKVVDQTVFTVGEEVMIPKCCLGL